jgi:hypothetical protein
MACLLQANRLTFSALEQEQFKSEVMELLFLPQLVLHQLRQTFALNTAQQQLFALQATTSQY